MIKDKDQAGVGIRNLAVDSLGSHTALPAPVSVPSTDFATYITSLGSTVTHLVINRQITLSGNVSIPSTVSMDILNISGGAFVGTGTITFNGPVNIGLYKAFGGSVVAVFATGSVGCVEASWWGPAEGGVSDSYAKLQAAITAATNVGKFHSKKTTYFLSAYLSLVSGCRYDFERSTIYTTTPTDGSAVLGGWVRGTSVSNIILENLCMYENNHGFPNSGSVQGIRFTGSTNITVRNCLVEYYNESQIRINDTDGFLVKNCETRNAAFRGIYVSGGNGIVEGCETHGNTYHGLYIGSGGIFKFLNNYSHDNVQYGFYMSTTGDSVDSNIVVENNRFIDNQGGGIIPDYHIGNLAILRNVIRSKYTQDSIIIMRDSPLGWYGGGSVDIIGNTMDGKIQAWNIKGGKIQANTCLWIEGRGFRNVDIDDNTITIQGVVLNASGYTDPESAAFSASGLVYGLTSKAIGQFWGYNQSSKRWFIKRMDTLKVNITSGTWTNMSASDIGKPFAKLFGDGTNGYGDGGNYGWVLDYDNSAKCVYVWMVFAEPAATINYILVGGTAGTYTVSTIEKIHPDFAAAETLKISNPNDGTTMVGAGVISATNHYNDIGIFIVSGDSTSLPSSNINIRNNQITDSSRAAIYIATVEGYCNIEGNRIENVALGVSTSTSYGIETASSTNPLDRVHVIKNNTIKNALTGAIRVGGGKWTTFGNRTDNSTGVSVATGAQASYGSIGDNDFYYGSATPAAGTWARGDRQYNTDPSAGIHGWTCTASGTFGTLGAVTGDTTNGSPTLTNTSGESGLLVGQYISLTTGFAAGPKLILAIDTINHTVKVDSNATSSTVGSVFSWSTPTFEQFGRKFNKDLTVSYAQVGVANEILSENSDNTNTASGAKIHAKVGGASGGNPWTHWEIPSVQGFSQGIDNAKVNDPLVMANAGVLTSGVIYEQYAAANGGRQWKVRNQEAKQAATVIAASDITLGTDGNVVQLTGTTPVNRVATANWQAGASVKILVVATGVIAHNGVATGGGFARILMNTAANFTAPALGGIVTLTFDGTDFRGQA